MKRIAQTLAITLALATFGTAALAGKGVLDGTRYQGLVKKIGADKGDADSITFDNGIFHSSACDQYGFKPSAYTATKDGDVIRFETISKSDSGATNTWKGTVRGDVIEAKLLWIDGKATQEFRFEGRKSN